MDERLNALWTPKHERISRRLDVLKERGVIRRWHRFWNRRTNTGRWSVDGRVVDIRGARDLIRRHKERR